ncbi:MAG TPA: nitroreductase family protein [Desulfomonilia bacterium]|nr:nitroreductase family protein [Desulfomonilia bacterium]
MLDLIKTRRSIRAYSDKEVGDDLLDKVLEAARWAPSGMNNQPWRFAVIRDTKLKGMVSGLTRYSKVVQGAGVLVAVFLDTAESYNHTKDVQSVGACIQNMLLEIHALGLGGVWLGEILKSGKELKVLLEAPDTYELMAVIALGYPSEPIFSKSERKELTELVFFRK